MNEYLTMQGRRLENANRIKEAELRLTGLRRSLRNCLDPVEKLVNLEEDRVAMLAFDFQAQMKAYREALAEAEEINKILGK